MPHKSALFPISHIQLLIYLNFLLAAVPVEPVTEEDASAKNVQPGEPSQDDTLGEIGTTNAQGGHWTLSY